MADNVQSTGFYVIGDNLITADPNQYVHYNAAHYGAAKEFPTLEEVEAAFQQSNPIEFKAYLRSSNLAKFAQLYPSEVVQAEAILGTWLASVDYSAGDAVYHDGQAYVAAPDVATGYAPDDVYDRSAGTGGWYPVEVIEPDPQALKALADGWGAS